MRHLFIINPAATNVGGRVSLFENEIKAFFKTMPDVKYEVHVTRWVRDAWIFTRNLLLNTKEKVRVHCWGGAGTFFEVVNGTAGLSNAEVALYPYGSSNEFVYYFGKDKIHLFKSIAAQVNAKTTPIDLIRVGNKHVLSHVNVGMEAMATRDGVKHKRDYPFFPGNFCFLYQAVRGVLFGKYKTQQYQIELDGQCLDNVYSSVMIANGPCYGNNMAPAKEAHPNNGIFQVYLFSAMPRVKTLMTVRKYLAGNHDKTNGLIRHFSGKKMKISSNQPMCVSLEGEVMYKMSLDLELVSNAVNLVCPDGIDITRLPRLYNRPDSGFVGETKHE
jgi:diacylglycerol kinase family enzyme